MYSYKSSYIYKECTFNDPNAVTWLSGGGLSIDTSTLIATPGPATKIIDAMQSTEAFRLEAWVKPANTTQSGPARIVTLSQNTSYRNVTLGQGVTTGDQWDVRFRTTSTNNNGTPSLTTAAGTLTTALTHVVYTRAATGETKIYLDGVLTAQGTAAGTVENWKNFFQLAFGNELTGGGGRGEGSYTWWPSITALPFTVIAGHIPPAGMAWSEIHDLRKIKWACIHHSPPQES